MSASGSKTARVLNGESLVVFAKRHWYSGAILVVVLLLGNTIEEHSDQFPWLIQWQLGCASLLSRVDPRTPVVERVTVVEIDNNTFWKRLAGVLPTDRHFLANLVRIGSGENELGMKAAVIAIDIKLVSPYPRPGDHPSRAQSNAELQCAVQEASGRGVPTILTASLIEGATKREPNIFDDSQWAPGTKSGYINLPEDKRLVPLQADANDWNGKDATFNSFALETALAYDGVHHLPKLTDSNSVVHKAVQDGDFLNAGFLKKEEFPRVSASDIEGQKRQALELINQKIMMIGSTWRESGTKGDFFSTPVGEMPGIYVHANYVESLLDRRVRRPVSKTTATVVDAILGILLVVLLERAKTWIGVVGAFGVFFAPLLIAYIAFINLGLYLDFALPLILLLLHPVIEHYWTPGEGGTHGGIPDSHAT